MPHLGGGNAMKIYQFEMCGKSHINLNIECQDSHKCIISEDGSTTITALADGVGSSKFAKDGAQTAVNAAIEVCRKHFPIEKNPEDFKAVIRMAMIAAEKEVIACAKRENDSLVEFATTLMVVIGVDDVFYYGFCGDGGIIAIRNGLVEKITTPQKGDDGESVITLISGSSTMEFGIIKNVDALAIATDGVYDKLCDNRLCINKDSGVYNNLCYALMDVASVDNPEKMYADAFSGDTSQLYANLYRHIERKGMTDDSLIAQINENAYFNKLLNSIHDDITLVVVFCNENSERIPADTYKEINLHEFLADLNRQLYPGIKSKKETIVHDDSASAEIDITMCDETSNENATNETKEELPSGKKAKKHNTKVKRRNFFLVLLAIIVFRHRKRRMRKRE